MFKDTRKKKAQRKAEKEKENFCVLSTKLFKKIEEWKTRACHLVIMKYKLSGLNMFLVNLYHEAFDQLQF